MDKQENPLRVFGRRLSQLREEQGISIEQLAARTGLDPSDIARIESGEQDLPITAIFRLAEGLGILPAQLLTMKP